MEETKTSATWLAIMHSNYGVILSNPTGWDSDSLKEFCEERITKKEFISRMMRSTIEKWDEFLGSEEVAIYAD